MDIVEHVARAIEDELAVDAYAREIALKLAPFAIKATLGHARDNISSEMEFAGLKAGNFVNDGEAMKSEFRAMIEQALKELDA